MYANGMRDLSVTEFRRHCLTLIDELPAEGVIITRHGQPVAKLTPIRLTRTGERVSLPLLEGKGEPGPLCPNTETPYDLIVD
jgi:prevent-host-death family protein